jgi:hypothetical protein
MKIRSVVAEFTHVDGQTYRHDEADRRLLRLNAHAPKILNISEVRLNPLKPNDPYRGRNAPLTSKVAFYIFIQQI